MEFTSSLICCFYWLIFSSKLENNKLFDKYNGLNTFEKSYFLSKSSPSEWSVSISIDNFNIHSQNTSNCEIVLSLPSIDNNKWSLFKFFKIYCCFADVFIPFKRFSIDKINFSLIIINSKEFTPDCSSFYSFPSFS